MRVTKQIGVRIDDTTHAALSGIATRNALSVADVARWCLLLGLGESIKQNLQPPSERRKSGLGSASEKTRREVSRAGVMAKAAKTE